MSFNNRARKAKNLQLPFTFRRSAARSCLLRLGWLTGQPRSVVAACFTARLGFDALQPGSEEQLQALVGAMEITRNRILEQVRAFDRKRMRDKWRNRRRPSVAQVSALQEAKLALLREAGPANKDLPEA
jgi:hypothetical protein